MTLEEEGIAFILHHRDKKSGFFFRHLFLPTFSFQELARLALPPRPALPHLRQLEPFSSRLKHLLRLKPNPSFMITLLSPLCHWPVVTMMRAACRVRSHALASSRCRAAPGGHFHSGSPRARSTMQAPCAHGGRALRRCCFPLILLTRKHRFSSALLAWGASRPLSTLLWKRWHWKQAQCLLLTLISASCWLQSLASNGASSKKVA